MSVPMEKIDNNVWRIPKSYKPGMRVPSLILANDYLLKKMKRDRTLNQIVNVTHLPGISKHALILPDGHEGYGFPIGGVAATDYEEGVISPGGVGYDINCGVRLLTTCFLEKDIHQKIRELTELIFKKIPSGLGSRRKDFQISFHQLDKIVMEGVPQIIDMGYGRPEDIKHCEENGHMEQADSTKVSNTAKKRGLTQVGTLGSGNHFLEIQKVKEIYDPKVAKKFGIINEDQVAVMIHCGSRGFGHQICSDNLRVAERAIRKYNIMLPDRELSCTPGKSEEGQNYFKAMSCAVNYAFVNRQMITHWVRKSFENIFKLSSEKIGLDLVYDVAHNIAKIEEHDINRKRVKVWIHRKGATRAFPPEHKEVPLDYRSIGQPVLIPGSMGTSSYVLVGAPKAMEVSFGSTAHGAGRLMSRSAAKRQFWGADIKRTLESRGILVRSASTVVLAEEADPVYKEIDQVVNISDAVGIATRVAKLVPLAVIKG
jgi:tRNA-splicing ligase RtcB